MRMFRSFCLRLALILSTTAAICLFLMVLTLGMQDLREGMIFSSLLFGLVFLWLIINYLVIRRIDPEPSLEVARLVWPAGALLSLALSILLALELGDLIPGTEGYEHLILVFVGVGVAIFLMVRCFDIRWLRGEDEIAGYESRDNG